MANLAIKGHATRGKEVVEIIEMLGGKTHTELNGNLTFRCYYIKPNGFIDYKYPSALDNVIIYSLEEFLENFPYKVGDKVNSKHIKNCKIEKAEWVSSSNRVIYKLQGFGWHSVEDLQPYKKETMEKDGETFGECIEKTIDIRLFGKKETIDRKYNVDEYLKVWKETDKGLEVVVNDRFELKKDNDKFYIIKKQIQYPNTLEECANLLDTLPHTRNGVSGYYSNLLWRLQQLFICRNAYWKIAGEDMGLGKPWEPVWENERYSIYRHKNNEIIKGIDVARCIHRHILEFPTEEMRDAFYENFKTLIEQCKELL